MLNLQQYLRSGNSLDSLGSDLGINVYSHPDLPLVGFKYSQIDSPKTNPIVKECRGIVLERDSWDVVAKPFNRFFNAGEDVEEFKKFNWSDFTVNSKEDGSLIILYHYKGDWHVNTSGSFGLGEVPFSGMSWRELFWQTAGDLDRRKMDPSVTYIFELCTIWNKVVRRYAEASTFLLSAIRLPDLKEFNVSEADDLAREIHVRRPENYHFSSMDEIAEFLTGKEEIDRTFEGVIIRDSNNQRWKIKTKTYTALHHLHDNGNLFNPKRLVPLLLAGEAAEIIAYFPEGKEQIDKVEADLVSHWDALLAVWKQHWKIEGQKEFALAIKGVPFSNLLFSLRKECGGDQTEAKLKLLWRNNADGIVKKLYG